MKETGLMFKAPLVRAILSGQKTQTRRLVDPAPAADQELTTIVPPSGTPYAFSHERIDSQNLRRIRWENPVGQPGDRIYVRETFARVPTVCGSDELVFAADYQDGGDKAAGVKYTPAIHMFKHDARIWLEVTGVRVERLQEITPNDCIAEGAWPIEKRELGRGHEAVEAFRELWDSTTGRPALPANKTSKRYARVKQWLDTHPNTTGWAANPWVWVIDFKRIEKP